MALARHEFTVVDEHGNIVTNAQVEVRREIAGQPLAPLYSDRDGTVPLGNPFPVDAETGVAAFHVAGGAYRIRAFKTGFERIERYKGIGTASETDAGLLPVAVSPTWLFDDTTADADPGDGEFRLNNATPSSATAAYIDNLAFGGADVSAWLDTLDDSGDTTTRGVLTIFDPTAPTTIFRIYAVSGSVIDGTGYRKLTLGHVAGAGSFTAGMQYQISFAQRGPIGQVPSSRTITAGNGLTGGGDLSADRTLAVGAGTGITVTADAVGLSDMAQGTIKGRASGAGTGAPADLTADQVRTITGQGLTLLNSGTVNNAATLDIVLTGYTGYRGLRFVLCGFLPVTDDVELRMRVSTNSGSSYDASGYSRALVFTYDTASGVFHEVSSSDVAIRIAGSATSGESVSNVAEEGGANTIIDVFDQTATGRWPRANIISANWHGATVTASFTCMGTGTRETAQDTDAVRFLFESGNIASGKWAVYGYN